MFFSIDGSRAPVGALRTDAEVAVAMAQELLGAARKIADEPAYQVALTSCVDCHRTVRHVDGEAIEVPESVCACAECDGEVVGLTESPFTPFLADDDSPTSEGDLTHVGLVMASAAVQHQKKNSRRRC